MTYRYAFVGPAKGKGVKKEKAVVAITDRAVISEAESMLQVLNSLGAQGWRVVASHGDVIIMEKST